MYATRHVYFSLFGIEKKDTSVARKYCENNVKKEENYHSGKSSESVLRRFTCRLLDHFSSDLNREDRSPLALILFSFSPLWDRYHQRSKR